MNEDYYKNQINHLNAVIDEFENKSNKNNIYNIMNETIDEAFWVTNLDLKFNFVSASIKKILGYTYEELANTSIENYLINDSVSILKNKLTEELNYLKENPKNNPDHFERVTLNFKHKSNPMTIWCEVKIRILLDDKFKPVSILGTTKDITEQKLIEETLYKKLDLNENKILEELERTKIELEKTKTELEKTKIELYNLKNK